MSAPESYQTQLLKEVRRLNKTMDFIFVAILGLMGTAWGLVAILILG
jgi:hypothetical protein